MDNKLDLLDKILARNIAWIAAADSKAAMLFAIDSAMLGVLAALVPTTSAWTIWASVIAVLATLALLVCAVLIVWTLWPRIKGPQDSLIFFLGISARSSEAYCDAVLSGSDEATTRDFALQCHRNAQVAAEKFKLIRAAMVAMIIAVPLWLVAIYVLYQLRFLMRVTS
jgi:hypothetical protein